MDWAVAELVASPAPVEVTLMFTVALCPGARLPSWHVTVRATAEQVFGLAQRNNTWGGKASLSTTPVAGVEARLVTLRV